MTSDGSVVVSATDHSTVPRATSTRLVPRMCAGIDVEVPDGGPSSTTSRVPSQLKARGSPPTGGGAELGDEEALRGGGGRGPGVADRAEVAAVVRPVHARERSGGERSPLERAGSGVHLLAVEEVTTVWRLGRPVAAGAGGKRNA